MILDPRGEPVPDAPATGYGFIPSAPVRPRPKPAQLANDGLDDAIGFEQDHPEDQDLIECLKPQSAT